jgi:hypothetical protein
LLACLLPLAACAGQVSGPDLGEIYSRAAQMHGPGRNPVIVIPGILGSRLVDRDSGAVVWGTNLRGYADPRSAAGARLVALPLHDRPDVNDEHDAVVADGALDRLQLRFFGVPVEVAAYRNLLLTLGAGGYADESLGTGGGIDYGNDHFTCFQFAYDWRLDNAGNARRLDEFIREKRALVQAEFERRYGVADYDVRFDIVAHSMGGLLTRYYLRYGGRPLPADGSLPALDWAGARFVDRAILIAPPNGGSVLALAQLVNGRRIGPLLPHYSPVILGTMPSIYQLLPRTRHHPVRDGETRRPVADLYSLQLWEKMGWGLAAADADRELRWLLPDVADPAERRRLALHRLRTSLERARQFAAALDVPASPPPGTTIHVFAGDSVLTADRLDVDRRSGALEVERFAPGDGTVTRASALMDERQDGEWSAELRSPVDWASVTFLFDDHLGLTRQPELSDNLLHLLLEQSR